MNRGTELCELMVPPAKERRSINWSWIDLTWKVTEAFLSAGWEAIVKWSLKPSWRSWIPWLSPSSADWLCRLRRRLPGGSGSLSLSILPALFHPLLITGRWLKRCLLAAGSTAGSNKQQGTGLALQEGLDKDSAAVKLLAAMSRVGSSSSSDDFQQAISH